MTARTYSKHSGFVLLSVIVMLAVLASLVLMASSMSNTERAVSASLSDTARLEYAAESGLEYAMWVLNRHAGCDNYPDIPDRILGDVTFSSDVSPKSGSPVALVSRASLGDVATREASRNLIVMYDRSSPNTLTLSSEVHVNDSFLEGQSGHQDHNKQNDKDMVVSGAIGKEKRGVLAFELGELPPGVRIESALLHLDLNTLGSVEPVELFRLTQSWNEAAVTWEERDTGVAWNTPGGDYHPSPIAMFETGAAASVTVDLTLVVGAWAAGQFANYGMIFITPEVAGAADNKFTSSEESSSLGPTLEVTYSCRCDMPCSGIANLSVAHWRFDDGTGLVAVDSAGGHDGTLTNGPVWLETGHVNGSLDFDGNNDHIVVSHDDTLSFETSMTVTAWIRLAAGDLDTAYDIVSKETPGTDDNYWLSVDNLGLLFGIDGDVFATNNVWDLNRWHHVAATYDQVAGEVRLYVDGLEEVVESTNAVLVPNNASLYLGGNWEHVRPFTGQLDDVRLYAEALSEEDILAIRDTTELSTVFDTYRTYRDQFNLRDFDGNDGTVNWSGDWLEIGESNGAVSGDITVSEYLGHNYSLRIRDNDNGGEGVQREFNLQDCSSARLAFDYRRDGLDQASDYVSLSLSVNGGATWVEQVRFEGPDDDVRFVHYATDLTGYLSANTRLRFLSSPTLGATDEVWFDNVTVTCD